MAAAGAVAGAGAGSSAGGDLVRRALMSTLWVWLFAAALAAALIAHNLFALNYVHIICALLWTGTDLFMGFIVGPVMRRLAPPQRAAVMEHLMPRMLFYMPVIAAVTTTSGWFLAQWLGLASAPATHGWFIAAGVITVVMFIQGIGLLLPTNLRVYVETHRPDPDLERVRRLMTVFMRLTAWQGVLQLVIIFVMVHFVLG